ncbi:hypothetical protein Patl1_12417 [Pistacia atlantica]|uniref:Uncharacterized protein n=1 Tax=Pistacia atlantica TaxID=434234 RepID=A0ACC1A6R3_9ROSI|nr:hypothetical protein Patl1_12417 [Pistacia atlantica]
MSQLNERKELLFCIRKFFLVILEICWVDTSLIFLAFALHKDIGKTNSGFQSCLNYAERLQFCYVSMPMILMDATALTCHSSICSISLTSSLHGIRSAKRHSGVFSMSLYSISTRLMPNLIRSTPAIARASIDMASLARNLTLRTCTMLCSSIHAYALLHGDQIKSLVCLYTCV